MSLETVTVRKERRENGEEKKYERESLPVDRDQALRDEHFTVQGEETEREKEEKLHCHQKLLKMIDSRSKVFTENNDETRDDKSPQISHVQKTESPSRAVRIATNCIDFLPIIGSIKMVVEGLQGKQLGTGKEITGKQRLVHGLSGALFLGLDVTGFGAIISEIGKIGIKVESRFASKEAIKLASEGILKEEGVKLAERGMERVERKEKIEHAA